MRKKRILWVSEASFMATGFSTLTMEILQRLHATGKYELAELGCYAKSSDPRTGYLPWTFYGGIPEANDALGIERYNNSIYGQFGESVFEQVCLDFKPDIVIDVRDWWMCEYQLRSPYRRLFKLMWMPTVDGEPQRLEWLDSYSRADMILTYSKYGKEVLEREAPGKIKVFDIVGPGVDHELFKPMDKKLLRSRLSIPADANIIMTVMRNQRRKLYPDLIETFKEYLKYCAKRGDDKLASNTYLYLHTSYPDVGFDIARHIMQNGVGHRVLTTYVCQNCKTYYVDFFQTELTTCAKCGALAAHMPNTQNGVSRQQLAALINLADLYVQYSICEGFGMPLAEGKACGVPAMGIDYSATSEQVNAPGCTPIKVAKFFYEPVIETEQKRALPDVEDAVKKFYEFFKKSPEDRQKLGVLARKDAVENHSFNRAANVFERAIDSMEIHDPETTWDNPSQVNAPMNTDIPKVSNNSAFIDWCLDNILGRPDLKNTYWRNELVKGLNVGFNIQRGGREQFNHETAVNLFIQLAKNNNFWEYIRTKPFATKQELKWETV
jgi:glycosyltransferase involved in cell wall biosynthesis